MKLNAISLFCSSGIGDLGLRKNGINTVISCELLPERADLFSANYPECKVFTGDIWKLKDSIISAYKDLYGEEEPFMILATPPCQGMSSNGMGKMLSDFRKGLRPEMDERNRLIVPALDIICALKPKWVLMENVANMENTVIYDEKGNLVNIISYIRERLGSQYHGAPAVVDVADYGVPQHRKRLITVFCKSEKGINYFLKNGSFIPLATHGEGGSLLENPWITLREAIGSLPPLEARKGKNIDPNNSLHKVPILNEEKLWWVHNTKEGSTAFNNQCVNPDCLFTGNKNHGASHDGEGINKANSDTPLYCEKCGSLLPRPCVTDKNGQKRIMKGFTSAYKRMSFDEPASTLTQNFQYACSDNKLHPTQDRVLSLYEGLILQSIAEYPFSFMVNGKQVSDSLIRDTIGESVPPKIIDVICENILKIEK